jgi:hypothetical protein
LGKNLKLTPKWIGPYKFIDINDKNAKLQIKPNKFKVINVSRLKHFKGSLKNVFLKMINVFFKAINVFLKTLHLKLLKGLSLGHLKN